MNAILSTILSMFQTIETTSTESTNQNEGFFAELKELSFDDAVSKISDSLVDFAFKLIIAILIFYIGKFIITRLYKITNNIMLRRNIDPSLTTFVLSFIKITLYFILIITIIGILGIETSSFLALFASAGVAIGMALSGTLQNFAGGVLILFLKPYKVGDYIEALGFSGTVKEIQIFHTVINTPDNKSIIIPNGGLSTSSINNYSMEDYRRVDWTISLAYGTDYKTAKENILKMLLEDDRVVKEYIEDDRLYIEKKTITKAIVKQRVSCKPLVEIDVLADSSIKIAVKVWTHSSNYWDLYFNMNERFYTELPKKGFEFPFPQIDVHVHK